MKSKADLFFENLKGKKVAFIGAGVSHKKLIEIFTDEGDVVIDPVAGSGSTLRACAETGRNGYGFEIKKDFYKLAKEKMISEDILNGIMENGQITLDAII